MMTTHIWKTPPIRQNIPAYEMWNFKMKLSHQNINSWWFCALGEASAMAHCWRLDSSSTWYSSSLRYFIPPILAFCHFFFSYLSSLSFYCCSFFPPSYILALKVERKWHALANNNMTAPWVWEKWKEKTNHSCFKNQTPSSQLPQ